MSNSIRDIYAEVQSQAPTNIVVEIRGTRRCGVPGTLVFFRDPSSGRPVHHRWFGHAASWMDFASMMWHLRGESWFTQDVETQMLDELLEHGWLS